MKIALTHLALALLLALLSGCRTTGSDDSSSAPPDLMLGPAFHHGLSTPGAPSPRLAWNLFADPQLDELLATFDRENPSIAVGLARIDKARANFGITSTAKTPTIRGSGDAAWRRDSENGFFPLDPPDYEFFNLGMTLEYELDVWGRVRRTVEAAQSDLEAEISDNIAGILPIKAQLVRSWYQLRFLDDEDRQLQEAIALRQENVDLIKAQLEGGEVTEVDHARALTELELTRAEQHDIGRRRAALANLIATLCGSTPATFSQPLATTAPSKISVPITGLPSELLRRRPDLDAAHKRLQASHARNGLTRANYLPKFTLGAGGGLSSLSLADLFDPKSLFTSIGPNVTIPLYNGGRNKKDKALAEARTREAYATFEVLTLNAVREVEDALSNLHWLDKHITALKTAEAAASETARLSQLRYEGGVVSYLEVVDAERTALTTRRQLTGIHTARRLALVNLIEALGGGWQAAE